MDKVYEVWDNCELEYDKTNIYMVSQDKSKRFSMFVKNIHDEYAEVPSTVRMSVTNERFFREVHHVSEVHILLIPTETGKELKITFINDNDKTRGSIMYNCLEGSGAVEWFYLDGCKVDTGGYKFYGK